MKPAVLDERHEIILANWPNNKHMICNDNNNIPVKIPSHPYVLINGTVLCNCGIEAEDNFLVEYIAACPCKQSALTCTLQLIQCLCIILTAQPII